MALTSHPTRMAPDVANRPQDLTREPVIFTSTRNEQNGSGPFDVTSPAEMKVADASSDSWVYRLLPQWVWPYAQLARWERPIGCWLLMWPCWWSAALALNAFSFNGSVPGLVAANFTWYLLLFLIGAIAMRGAGCTYNDLVDVDIDDKVARTRSRPLPSGRATKKQAVVFLLLQALVGFAVLIQFNWLTIQLGLVSLVTVMIYPFMKRITWWPQLFLGFSFSWGALMGWPALVEGVGGVPLALYAGCILWVIGYDTIYAHQDKEDDALIGVKSTARLFGDKTKPALVILYSVALALFVTAFAMTGVKWPAFLGLALGALHMIWQIVRLDINDADQCMRVFRSNNHFGWIVFLGLVASAVTA